MIIPTGVGASIGGYGGDATPEMNLLASVCDILITHPNVANAAMFQKLPENVLYVEGYGLDQFFKGKWSLHLQSNPKIGIVLDAGIPPDMLNLHINTIHAVQSVYGMPFIGYTMTDAPVDIQCGILPSGSSTGTLQNPGIILQACKRIIEQGATAIALCVFIPPVPGEAEYGKGNGVDPIGGIEAILSHWVVSQLHIPCAHAPVFKKEDIWDAFYGGIVDPRAASEYITPTFLPCVLTGLRQAPAFLLKNQPVPSSGSNLSIQDLDVLVLPADALGGIPALSAMEQNIPLITVIENHTVAKVTQETYASTGNIYIAHSYEEAAGLIQGLRLGLMPAHKRKQKTKML